MADTGGPPAIAGYNFQLWYTAFKLAEAFWEEDIIIQPEGLVVKENVAGPGETPKFKETLVTVDDLIVTIADQTLFYNMKYLSPGHGDWDIGELKNANVLQSLYSQTQKFPNGRVVLVSMSACPFLYDAPKRARPASSLTDFHARLSEKLIKECNEVKAILGINDEQTMNFLRSVSFEHVWSVEFIRDNIQKLFKDLVSNEMIVGDSLYQLASEGAKERRTIFHGDIVKFLQRRKILESSRIDSKKLEQSIETASAALSDCKSTFGSLISSHLKRGEVESIISLINQPLPAGKDPIFLVVGPQGCGKSVIIKDVLGELHKQNPSVLAIKADHFISKSQDDLAKELGLMDPIDKILSSLSKEDRKVFLIIDQIDALSQSMMVDQRPLITYFNLVQRLKSIPNIRIVISCRAFDLHFDPFLQKIEHDAQIQVGDLSEIEVQYVLKLLNINLNALPKSLQDLLRNANNLNIFCSIYSNNLSLGSIRTLQDLYAELWNQKVLAKDKSDGSMRVAGLINELVSEMHEKQKLFLPKASYTDRYPSEFKYLESEGILKSDQYSVEFLHQSFSDYAFARIFADQGKSIFQIVLKSHQGLRERSLIKQILGYLRGINPSFHEAELNAFLSSKRIRFHLKLMLMNELGFEKDPAEYEKSIVKKHILSNSKLRVHFLDSIRLNEWLEFLIDSGVLRNYLKSQDKQLIHSCTWMLHSMVEIAQSRALNFIDLLANSPQNSNLIHDVLLNVDNWADPLARKLFKRVENLFATTSSWDLFQIMEKAGKSNPEWAFELLTERANREIEKRPQDALSGARDFVDSESEHFIEGFMKVDAQRVFDFSFPLVIRIAEKTKFQEGIPYFTDSAFWDLDEDERIHGHSRMYEIVARHLAKLASEHDSRFKTYSDLLKDKGAISLLNLLVVSYCTDVKSYACEIFHILSRPDFLIYHGLNDQFGHKVRQMIKEVFSCLSPNEKNRLISLIEKAEPEWERRKESQKRRGWNQYVLLKTIPEQELGNWPIVRKRFMELERKFLKAEDKKPSISAGGVVGPPLPQIAYEKMGFEQWIDSFREFDESTGWNGSNQHKKGFLKGGMVEHSRAFGGMVEKNPERFCPFVEKISGEDVAASYVAEGLSGLVKAKFDPDEVRNLVKVINLSRKENQVRRELINAASYLEQQNHLDDDIVEMLGKFAIDDPDPAEEVWRETQNGSAYYGGDPYAAGINSIRGDAALRLVIAGRNKELSKKVLDFLDIIARDKSTSVRCCAIIHLYLLADLDKERTFKIFLELTKDLDIHVVTYGLSTLSWLMHDHFEELKRVLMAAMQTEVRLGFEDARHGLGEILMMAYLDGLSGANQLLKRAMKLSDEAKAGALSLSVGRLVNKKDQDEATIRICLRFYRQLLKNRSKVVRAEYYKSFLKMKGKPIDDMYPLILRFTKKTKEAKDEAHWLYELLSEWVETYPDKCVSALEGFIPFANIDQQTGVFIDEPTRIIVGAYNRLYQINGERKIMGKAMDILDKMLETPAYRYGVTNVFREADYS